ncbi:hypothetical protein [Tsuneonella mangrovi]|uniref:hypothetical protein n=1 Tax=Tsuneonella mangrovi TaxID=1982042 RepID=UPI000BA277B0|nr:hypothetical protein [Tsuneonella mangrovi]
MTIKPAYLALPLLAILSACGSKQPAASDDENATAAGEILPGSASDAMLPLDTVKSQSPPLQSQPASAPSATPADSASDAPASAEATPAPTAQ